MFYNKKRNKIIIFSQGNPNIKPQKKLLPKNIQPNYNSYNVYNFEYNQEQQLT